VTVITPRGQESKQIVPPSKEDIRQLLAKTENDPDFYVRLLFSALSGARAGEQRALRWRDIDFVAASIKILASVDRFKVAQLTKTKAGERTVRMSDLLKRKMQEYRRSLFSQDDDLVFPSATGGFVIVEPPPLRGPTGSPMPIGEGHMAASPS
jgi:integrase